MYMQTMISAKDAIASALRYFTEMYRDAPFKNIRLEEIEMTADEKEWRITIGFDNETNVSPLAHEVRSIGGFTPILREYKTLAVSTSTGDVLAMKIRVFGNT